MMIRQVMEVGEKQENLRHGPLQNPGMAIL